MAIDSKFTKIAAPVVVLVALILAITATSRPWWSYKVGSATINLGLFSAETCIGSTCEVQKADVTGCDVDIAGAKTACNQFVSIRGLMVSGEHFLYIVLGASNVSMSTTLQALTRSFCSPLADILGFLALGAIGYLFLKAKDAPKFVSIGAMGITFLATLLSFIAMCLGASFANLSFWTDYYVPDIKWTLASGFIINIIAWIMGAVATVGTVLLYKAVM
ncbi:hypothetical protein HDU67_008800 [Dinochytrium kinnereticum]|nr:hypothetical protein HDU67_008800 [Dinochytrium kinnereticum]